MQLSLEERLAYEFALRWRDDSYAPDLENLDWSRFAKLLVHNRMAQLALQIFERNQVSLPPVAQKIICEQSERYKRAASKLGDALVKYLKSAETREIETIVLKGLWLCEKIYGNPSMRPGADIDILVRRVDVDKCLKLLEEQDIGAFWPNLLHDDYFARHHLHQQRSTPDLNIWFEIHWAFDHPYTLLTVDYNGIFERARAAQLLGAPVREMAPPDLLLSLAIHLVKHALYLPSLVEREDLQRIILADGMLMYYLDVAETVRQYNGKIDWNLTIALARQWGAGDSLGSVLRACNRYFGAVLPEEVLAALPVSGAWRMTRKWMARAADQKLVAYEGRPLHRFWQFFLASNGAFILRPVRLLETVAYFMPSSDYLNRRYGGSNFITRVIHFLRALAQSLRFGWDSLYFGIERYVRLKRLGKSASLFNKLEIDL
jgi:hypothetical protein